MCGEIKQGEAGRDEGDSGDKNRNAGVQENKGEEETSVKEREVVNCMMLRLLLADLLPCPSLFPCRT